MENFTAFSFSSFALFHFLNNIQFHGVKSHRKNFTYFSSNAKLCITYILLQLFFRSFRLFLEGRKYLKLLNNCVGNVFP